MAETQGISAMGLYNQNRDNFGMGQEMAAELDGIQLAQRQKMTPPVGGQDMSRPANAPEWYNYAGMQPAKYAVPNQIKERACA